MPQSVFLSIKNWEGVSLFFQEQPGCIAVSNTFFFSFRESEVSSRNNSYKAFGNLRMKDSARLLW